LIDVGSTTTDVIPIQDGWPKPVGFTDVERLRSRELIYTGVRATPICALLGWDVVAETFATTHDANIVLSNLLEEPANYDTADGRPATRDYAFARLARMLGGDLTTITAEEVQRLATAAVTQQREQIAHAIQRHGGEGPQIICGSGEFLARAACDLHRPIRSMEQELGREISTAACAYAVAQLAAESAEPS
jgi:probable H4MPT-linked C1 transfer pathway protein